MLRGIGRGTLLGALCALSLAAACWQTKPNPRYCDSSAECTDPTRPLCVLDRHECVGSDTDLSVFDGDAPDLARECETSAACTVATRPICETTTGACKACAAGDCTGTTPVCVTTGAKSGACVECTGNDQCAAVQKTCDQASNTCVACTTNTQCTSGACRADGTCALTGDIVYVDNKNGTCTGTGHAGTLADPHCQFAQAAGAAETTVQVAASTTAYNAIFLNGSAVKHIVGPGRDASPGVRFEESTKIGLNVILGGGTVNLSATGVVIAGSNGGTKLAGVNCAAAGASASVALRQVSIVDSGGVALDSSTCTIVLDGVVATSNDGGGVKLATTMYNITNSIIALNGNAGTAVVPGVQIDAASAGTFAFNTVARNTTSAGIAGVDCSASPHMIASSIVAQNPPAAAATQFNGSCTYANVVSGPDTATGPVKDPPTFVSTSDFHLDVAAGAARTANQLCCIDKITTPGPTRDVDGATRPKGASWDIGAHEAL